MEHIVIFLLGFTIIREAIFYYQLNKLVNKIMSKSFYEYKQATQLDKPLEKKTIKIDPSFNEDMGVLGDINGVI
jgi:hypothetical protein